MIETEIAVFALLFAAGVLSGAVAVFLLALGRGSRVARAIFDFLTPLVMGAVYFFALRYFASGVFRLYSLIAFLLGAGVSRRVSRALSPFLRKALQKAKVPIKSLERRVSCRVGALISPIKNRVKEYRLVKKEKARKARTERRQRKEILRREKQKKKAIEAMTAGKKPRRRRPAIAWSERAKTVD